MSDATNAQNGIKKDLFKPKYLTAAYAINKKTSAIRVWFSNNVEEADNAARSLLPHLR